MTRGATATGTTAVIVLYNIPHRDGGQYSAGGAKDAATYRAWVDKIAAKVASTQTYFIVEPDGVAMGMDAALQTERWSLLTYAVNKLGTLPNAKVYLDGGTPGWKTPAQMAPRLRSAGVASADGIAVNTSNFRFTSENVTYANAIVAALGGGKGIVIDTSRNGNGRYTGPAITEPWCNPPGRGLGQHPTSSTGVAGIDAYLWIKRPGGSDGACRGNPPAGDYMPEYALQMIRDTQLLPW